jgi:NADH-quinone oxidoreductase subunit C/D
MEYIKQEELRERIKELGYELLLDLTAVDYLKYPIKTECRFELVYIFRSLKSYKTKTLKVKLKTDEIESISDLYEGANWLERETFDQYGIIFKNHPNLKRILNHHQFIGHPLRKDYNITDYQLCTSSDSLMDELGAKLKTKGFDVTLPFCEVENKSLGTDLMFLNIGPSHPASHGTIRTLVALDGEQIITAVNEIGYLHRGFEKSCENHTYNQIIPYTDRLNYCSAMLNNVAFCKAIESALGVEITDRAKFIRVIVSELSRIIDHLVCLAAQLVDCGGLTNFWYLYNQREEAYELIQKLTGARLTNSYTRVGGLKHDLYDGFERDLEDVLKKIEAGVDDALTLIASNRIFLDRVQDVCKISDKEAISYGFTGPTLRASGVPFDLRRDNPYYYYDTFDFNIPIGSFGDIYDRVMVRFEEIRESSKIIRQAMKRLPDGDINIDAPKIVLPKKEDVYGNIEGLMNHFKLVFEGVKVPIGEYYDSLEGANGELGFYIVSDGSGTPYKVKVRPPCFFNMASMSKSVENHQVADAVLQLGSLNIIAGELDR